MSKRVLASALPFLAPLLLSSVAAAEPEPLPQLPPAVAPNAVDGANEATPEPKAAEPKTGTTEPKTVTETPHRALFWTGVGSAVGAYVFVPLAYVSMSGVCLLLSGKVCESTGQKEHLWLVPYAGPILVAKANPKEESGGYFFMSAVQIGGTALAITSYFVPQKRAAPSSGNVGVAPIPGGAVGSFSGTW